MPDSNYFFILPSEQYGKEGGPLQKTELGLSKIVYCHYLTSMHRVAAFSSLTIRTMSPGKEA